MEYLLDTNICIHFFKGKFHLINKIEQIGLKNCAISEITLAELVFGAENSSNPAENKKIIDKFSDQVIILPIFDAVFDSLPDQACFTEAAGTNQNQMIVTVQNCADFG